MLSCMCEGYLLLLEKCCHYVILTATLPAHSDVCGRRIGVKHCSPQTMLYCTECPLRSFSPFFAASVAFCSTHDLVQCGWCSYPNQVRNLPESVLAMITVCVDVAGAAIAYTSDSLLQRTSFAVNRRSVLTQTWFALPYHA